MTVSPVEGLAAGERAYEAIRNGIATGAYKPGMHMRAGDLADTLGISRTPVREALRRLSAEGLVEFFANRGAYVTRWSQSDVDEVFGLRVVLESYAAELAATRLTGQQIDELSRLAGRMESLADPGGGRDLGGISVLNGEFHRVIMTAAANRRLAAMIAGVVELGLVARTFSVYSGADLARSMAHHRELIAAFSVRDQVWAASIMRSHIRNAHQAFKTSETIARKPAIQREGIKASSAAAS